MTARQLSTVCLFLTIGLALAAVGVRVIGRPDDAMSKQTMVLVFPIFLALMTRKTGRYPRVGAVVSLIAACLAGAGLHLAMNAPT